MSTAPFSISWVLEVLSRNGFRHSDLHEWDDETAFGNPLRASFTFTRWASKRDASLQILPNRMKNRQSTAEHSNPQNRNRLMPQRPTDLHRPNGRCINKWKQSHIFSRFVFHSFRWAHRLDAAPEAIISNSKLWNRYDFGSFCLHRFRFECIAFEQFER